MTVLKDKGVPEVTVAGDRRTMFPPLGEILKTLCYSHGWRSYQGQMQTNVATTIGIIQILVGLFNIGLGPGRTSIHPGDFASLGAAYWLGAVFIVVGIMSILAAQFPSSCLVGFTVFMNIVGAIFAITGIVLYTIDLSGASLLWMCDQNRSNVAHYRNNCRNVALFAQNLLRSMDILLIILAVLLLCVSIWFTILGIKALTSGVKMEEGDKDV
ncbi:membrane-spanning 4-domains subfamily A member 4A-like [Mastacembelus armatus]|uniref:membrane-spanning 4-domains subfamily A member 4A-like n=1 Tax=Mastacembelus armatus TaxID=205130 RepID=UPI000E46075D|nr:membrane-spanning 4-domains subfamily A member 4A-like [Mastacembelus armatus]